MPAAISHLFSLGGDRCEIACNDPDRRLAVITIICPFDFRQFDDVVGHWMPRLFNSRAATLLAIMATSSRGNGGRHRASLKAMASSSVITGSTRRYSRWPTTRAKLLLRAP